VALAAAACGRDGAASVSITRPGEKIDTSRVGPVEVSDYSQPNGEAGRLVTSSAKPEVLVVLGHGCCYATSPQMKQTMTEVGRQIASISPAIVAIPDFRGDGRWNVMAGRQDVAAVAKRLVAEHPTIRRRIAWGISMGALATGLAVVDDPSLFQYWVSSAGVHDPGAEFPAASGTDVRDWVIADMGGATPQSDPAKYAGIALPGHAARFADLRRAYVVHGTEDRAVPFVYAQQLVAALRRASVPTTLVRVPGAQHDAAPITRALRDIIKPLVLGQDPYATGRFVDCAAAGSAAGFACVAR
jgi:acetyl esterase/lipase